MWYQSVSARSMPPARLPRVGTIQAAATTATATAASQTAIRDAGGAGGASPVAGRASRWTATAIASAPAIIVQASKAAKVPSASASTISAAIASTASATRAGAPDQPPSSAPRARQAA